MRIIDIVIEEELTDSEKVILVQGLLQRFKSTVLKRILQECNILDRVKKAKSFGTATRWGFIQQKGIYGYIPNPFYSEDIQRETVEELLKYKDIKDFIRIDVEARVSWNNPFYNIENIIQNKKIKSKLKITVNTPMVFENKLFKEEATPETEENLDLI